MTAPARHNHVFHGLKKPEIADLPTACAEASPFRRQPCFRATAPIWDGNRGDSRGKPRKSPQILVYDLGQVPHPKSFYPFVLAGRDPAIHILVERSRESRRSASRVARPNSSKQLALLELDLGASLLELRLDLLGFVLVDAFLDRLGSTLDEVLGFLEAEAGDGADFLDDFDLLLAGGGEHDRELGLFLNRSGGSAATGGTGHRNRGSGGHAPLLFKQFCEFGSFEHGQAREVVNNLL